MPQVKDVGNSVWRTNWLRGSLQCLPASSNAKPAPRGCRWSPL